MFVFEKPFGGVAAEFVDDTTAHAGDFYCLDVVEDTVIDTLVPKAGYRAVNFAGAALPAGAKIYGQFSSVKLTSGKLIAYYAS